MCDCDREAFKKTYTGPHDANEVYDYLVECRAIDERFSTKTYSVYNRNLIKVQKEKAFNKHVKSGVKEIYFMF